MGSITIRLIADGNKWHLNELRFFTELPAVQTNACLKKSVASLETIIVNPIYRSEKQEPSFY